MVFSRLRVKFGDPVHTASTPYNQLIVRRFYFNVVQSMSRRGNCWDNAVAESFFKTLKCELIYGNRTLNPQQLEMEIFEYIEIWYNKVRRHSALKNMTIDEFWKLNKMSA